MKVTWRWRWERITENKIRVWGLEIGHRASGIGGLGTVVENIKYNVPAVASIKGDYEM